MMESLINQGDIDFNHKFGYSIYKNFLTETKACEIVESVCDFENRHSNVSFNMDDGFFTPYPYSVLHHDLNKDNKLLNSYFDHAKMTREKLILKNNGSLFDFFLNLTENIFSKRANLLNFQNKKNLSAFGIRRFFANKNGSDIHCENAFVNQLDPLFKKWLIDQVDLFNAYSFFILLQKPKKGGELVLFNKVWDQFDLKLNESSYFERHDLEGSMFINRGEKNVEKTFIDLNVGDAILFPAAQRWHAINKIEGGVDRVSIGCFFAKGNDGKLYVWA